MASYRDLVIAFVIGLVVCVAMEVAINAFIGFATALLVMVQP